MLESGHVEADGVLRTASLVHDGLEVVGRGQTVNACGGKEKGSSRIYVGARRGYLGADRLDVGKQTVQKHKLRLVLWLSTIRTAF